MSNPKDLAVDDQRVVVPLRDETVGFGSRHAGQHMRAKARNLLAAEPSRSLCIDWSEIPMISSSYADEFVGKLFVELGPLTFMSRVRNTSMAPVVRGLIDRAIMQRSHQTMADIEENGDENNSP